MDAKVNKIKSLLNNTQCIHIDIDNERSIDNIYKLFTDDNIFIPTNNIEKYYLGMYHRNKNNYIESEKYWLDTINSGCVVSMYMLGLHYYDIEDYDKMVTYYLMAFNNGNHDVANNLGFYYNKVKNYDEMLKYYSIAIEHGDTTSMYNLGCYYEKIKEYDLMIKYFLMSVANGYSDAMYKLADHYENINIDLELAKKYYKMAADFGDIDAMYKIAEYNSNNKKLYKMYYLMAFNYGDVNNVNNDYSFDIILESIEIIMNFPDVYMRSNCVRDFKRILQEDITISDKIKFMQLLREFNFEKDDKLCFSLELILDLIKN